jgi:hypothetical protein
MTAQSCSEWLGRLGRLRQTGMAIMAASLLLAPAIIFYVLLFLKAVNLPLEDDYEALLDYLNQMAELKSAPARASYFLATQHNEYKLFFGHALVSCQLAFFGHIDIRILCAVGNGFILLLALLLWRMFLPNHPSVVYRMLHFIPVCWLLFQLQYVGTLNWAMPSLQNLPVIVFSLGGIYLLLRATRLSFWGAMICLALAVASSGNGLLMIPIGVLILAVNRQFARVVSWLVISAGCVAAYAFRYNVLSSQSRLQHSVFSTLIRPRPLYVIAFMGNAAAFPGRHHVIFGLSVGLLLAVFFVSLARRGYFRRNPLVSYCVLFLLLTAVGVAGLRSDFGIAQSLDSRYGIYSALFLIFAWFAIVEEILAYMNVPLKCNHILLVAIAGSVLFSLTMDALGWTYLSQRNQTIVRGMTAYEHPGPPGSNVGPILPFPGQGPRSDELDRKAPLILKQSMKLGIYRPPLY